MARPYIERGYLDNEGRWHPESDPFMGEAPRPGGYPDFSQAFQDMGQDFVENVTDAANQATDSVMSAAHVRVRSQITPELNVNLHDVVGRMDREEDKESLDPSLFGQATHWFLKNIARPEIEINILGTRRRIAPWGRPERNYTAAFWLLVAAGIGSAGYLGYKAIGRMQRK